MPSVNICSPNLESAATPDASPTLPPVSVRADTHIGVPAAPKSALNLALRPVDHLHCESHASEPDIGLGYGILGGLAIWIVAILVLVVAL